MRRILRVAVAAAVLCVVPASADALERICDTAFEDCRAPLIQLIDNETARIDFAFWFLEDARISAAVARAVARGVKPVDARDVFGQDFRQFQRVFSFPVPQRLAIDEFVNQKRGVAIGFEIKKCGNAGVIQR